MPGVRLSMGGDRRASQGHAWGSPKAGGCQWRPSGRSFDASALTTTRVAARHLVRGATRPLRRGRTSWMPTALGSVMGVQARGLLPARAGRRGSRGGLRAAKRRARARETRPSVSQGGARGNNAFYRPPHATPAPPQKSSPGQPRGLHYQHLEALKRPRRRRSTTEPAPEGSPSLSHHDDLRRRHQEL